MSEPFSCGRTEAEFLEKLLSLFNACRVNVMRGVHRCNLCGPESWSPRFSDIPSMTIGGRDVLLGNCELWFPGEGSTIYAAPSLIIHYVTAHDYRPPKEFLKALMNNGKIDGWNAESEFEVRIALSTRPDPNN